MDAEADPQRPHETALSELLNRHAEGDVAAFQQAIALVYDDIHAIALRALRGERELTLRPTALAHETYLRLVRLRKIRWRDRSHLLAMAAHITRQALIDEARRYRADKRHGGRPVTLSDTNLGGTDTAFDALDVDRLLRELAGYDAEAAQVVGLRIFGELSIEETATHLGLSVATINRRWASGKAWLLRELERFA